jgi:O-antigen/teichoic acid export membrane protein
MVPAKHTCLAGIPSAMIRRLVSYSAALYAMVILASVVRVGLRALIAKTAGMEALGAYAFFGTAIVIGTTITAVGLRRSLTKFVVAEGETAGAGREVSAIMALFVALSLVLWGCGLALRQFVDPVYFFVFIGLGPAVILELARAAFRGQFDQGREILLLASSLVAQALFIGSATLLFDSAQAPLWGAAAASLVVAAAVVGYFLHRYTAAWRFGALAETCRSARFSGLVALSMPIWVFELIGLFSHYADQVILQQSLGYTAMATYAAALTFLGLLDQPLAILSRISLVAFSGSQYTDAEPYQAGTSLNVMAFSVLGLAITALSIPFTPIIFTEEYTSVPTLVAILSVACIFQSAEVFNSSLTIARDFPGVNRDASIVTAVLCLPLAYVLVQSAGVIGAACSYTASWSIYAVVQALLMGRKLPLHAAMTLKLMCASALLYGLAVAAICRMETAWSFVAIAPAFLLAGHVLGIWNLKDVRGLVRLLQQKLPS